MTATATTTARNAATLPQRELLTKLFAEYNPLVADSLDARGPADGTPRDQNFSDMVNGIRNATHTPADFTGYTRSAASNMIDSLISSIRTLRREQRATQQSTQPTATATAEPGVYFLPAPDGDPVTVVKVQRTRDGARLYAKTLDVSDPEHPTWVYAPGLLTSARRAELRPLDKTAAARFGRQTGVCGDCGRLLTNPESIERGIGPICAAK